MPIETIDLAPPGTRAEQRANQIQNNLEAFGDPLNRRPVKDEPVSFGDVWKAQIGATWIQATANAMLVPRNQPDPEFNPFEFVDKEERLFNDPDVMMMVDRGQFYNSRSEDDFWRDYAIGKRFFDDMRTLEQASTLKAGTAMLGVAIGDPTNLIPMGAAFNAARKGTSTAKTIRMISLVSGSTLAFEKFENIVQPLTDEPGPSNELIAAGFGAAFGTGLTFLTSPVVRGSMDGLISSRKLNSMRRDIDKMLVGPGAAKQTDPNMIRTENDLVDIPIAHERSQGLNNVKALLAEDPVDNKTVSVLRIPGDEGDVLLEQLKAKYKAAGKTLHVIEHGEQPFLDMVLEARKLLDETTSRTEAVSDDFEKGFVDRALSAVSSRYANWQSKVTPGGRLAQANLARIVDVYRTLSGSAQTLVRGAADDPMAFRAGAAAENIKDIYKASKTAVILSLRQTYAGARKGDGPLRYNGTEIPRKYSYGLFRDAVTDYARRLNAKARGFDVQIPTDVDPLIKQAAENTQSYFLNMRNQMEKAGMIRGPVALAKAERDLAGLQKSLEKQAAKLETVPNEKRLAVKDGIKRIQGKIAQTTDEISQLQKAVAEQEFYLPHTYDVERIKANPQDFEERLARGFHNKDSMVDGRLVPNDERPLLAQVAVKLDQERLTRVVDDINGEPFLPFSEEGARSVQPIDQKAKLTPAKEADVAQRLDGLTEADLPADLQGAYRAELKAYYKRNAASARARLADPAERHGIADAHAQDPTMARVMDIDESDLADFLEKDIEVVLERYHRVIGGRMAVRRSIQLNPDIWEGVRLSPTKDFPHGRPIETGQDLIAYLRETVDTLEKYALARDKAAGRQPGSKGSTAPAVRKMRRTVERDMRAPIDMLEGRDPFPKEFSNSDPFNYFGRNMLRLSYVNKLGSVFWAQMNDVAPVTLYMMQSPQTLVMIPRTLLHMEGLPKRDLEAMGLMFDNVSRQRAISDTDYMTTSMGVGEGTLRQLSAKAERGGEHLAELHGKVSLMNWITNVNKRLSGTLVIDRLTNHSKRLLNAQKLISSGMTPGAAYRKVGLDASGFDAAKISQMGLNAKNAQRYHELVYKHGLTTDDVPIRETMTFEQYMDSNKFFKPNFAEWNLAKKSDADLIDTLMANISGEVNRSMVVTPGAFDRPILNARSPILGRMFNQFQTFGMAFVNQRLKVMAQMPAQYQVWYMMSYYMLGAISDAVSNDLSGRRSISETAQLWGENPLGMSYAAWERSGMAGWLGRPLAFADATGIPISPGNLLDNRVGSTASRHIVSPLDALGPTFNDASRIVKLGGRISQGEFDDRTAYNAAKLAPMQNLIWLRLLHRATGLPTTPESLIQDKLDKREPRP